jgi:AAA domain, putative AbiEii toxin, Type IV TA system
VSLPLHGLVLVAGANNSGKSALLSALDVIAGSKQPAAARHAAASEPARVLARFALSEEERAQLLASVSDPTILKSDALTWLEWHFIQVDGGGLVPLELHTAWPGHSDIPLARVSTPDGKLWVSNAVLTLQGMLDQGSGLAERGSVGVQSIEGVLAGRVQQLAPATNFLTDWRQRYYHFEPLRPGTNRTMRLATPRKLVPTGANLPGVLLHLQTNRFAVWEQIRALISQIVPDVGRLDTPTDESNQMEVAFADPHLPLEVGEPVYRHNIKDLGTGVEQLLMAVVVGVTQPAPSVVVIEEPETNLHAGAQRALLALLREWATNRLFVVSTHSSVFLDRTPDADLLLVRRARGVSTVQPVKDDPAEALTELGIRFSDLLSAEQLLLVEGPSDRNILARWFPNRMLDPRVAVREAQGGDDARLVDRLDAWMKALDQLGRPVLFLRDRDELPKRLLDRLEASPLVHVLRRRELENYLLDPAAITKVLSEREPSISVEPERVLTALREAADELKPVVVMKRVAWELEPIYLVNHRLRDQLAQQRATLEQFQAAVLQRLPTADELRSKIADMWAEAEAAVNDAWEERWRELAPGADVLPRAWAALGAAYDKQVDGPAIAAAMDEPPRELDQLLHDLLDEQ